MLVSMNKHFVIWMLGILAICQIVSAGFVFNDGNTYGNLTFSNASSQYLELNITDAAIITLFSIQFKGYSLNNSIDVEDTASYEGASVNNENPGVFYDEDWTTWTYSSGAPGDIGYIYENVTIPNGVKNINWTFKYGETAGNGFFVECYNYSKSDYSFLHSGGNTGGWGSSATITAIIPSGCYQNNQNSNLLRMKTTIEYNAPNKGYYFEGKVDYTSTPTNITVKANNTQIYQNDSFTSTTAIITPSTINSICNDFIDGECNLELNITSYFAGILEYSNFQITSTTAILNLSFFDEITESTIAELISIEIISDDNSSNYSTSTSKININHDYDGVTLIRYDADSYAERHYYVNITSGHNAINLYLINSSLVTDVTVTIIDETNNNVEGAYIEAMRYDIDTNSYITREIYKTNVEGAAQLNLIQDDEFYKFLIEYPFGQLRFSSEPAYIYDNSIEIQIQLGDEIAETYFNVQGIYYTLTFNNNTNIFTLTYSDTNNLMSRACLNIYKITSKTETLANSSCIDSASGSIALKVANESGVSYDARALAGFSPATNFFGSLMHTFKEAGNPLTYNLLWLDALLTICVAMVGFWSLAVMIILIPLPTLFMSLASLISIPLSAIISLQIVAFILAYVISRYS